MDKFEELQKLVIEQQLEISSLKEALRAAHGLIDNDLVIPWIIAYKLDDVLK